MQGKDAFDGLVTVPTITPEIKRTYRSAKARAFKKVKIKPDGTW